MLRELRGQLSVGLHLDWTSAFAVRAGHGLSLPSAVLRAALGQFIVNQAKQVIAQQLDAFEAVWQAPPEHVDGHQHIQQFSGIRQGLLQVLAQRYPQQQPWLWVSRVVQLGIKPRIISALGARALQRAAQTQGMPYAAPLWGAHNFAGESMADYAEKMQGWLAQSTQGSVLMCHPANAMNQHDPIGQASTLEYGYLCSPPFALHLQTAQVQLVSRPV